MRAVTDHDAAIAPRHPGTVYLVDDDASVLRMLEALVATVGVDARPYASAREFLAAYQPLPCECLVSDLRMPDIDGIGLQQHLAARAIAPPIIFLTGYAEVGVAVEAMRRGAFDFLQKPFSAQILLGKIQAALSYSRERHALWLARQTQDARRDLLSPRERTVVELVVAGRSSREIADQLELSVRTVENHRTRIMEKLHVSSTVELVKLFL